MVMENLKLRIFVENGKYLIPADSELYSIYDYRYELYVDGVELPRDKGIKQINKPTEIKLVKTTQVVDHYEDTITKKIYSSTEYNDIIEDLKNKGNYSDSSDEWVDIDYEYQYKKFIRNIDVHYKNEFGVISYTDFEFIPIIQSKYDSIVAVNGVVNSLSDMLFVFFPNKYDILNEASTRTGYTIVDDDTRGNSTHRAISVATHSDFKYLKINGNYAKYKDSEIKLLSFRGTYEECVEKRNKYINDLVEIIKYNDSFLIVSQLTVKQIGYLLKELNSIKTRVYKIDEKVSGRMDKNAALKSITTLIDDLTNGLNDENK